MAAVRQTPAPLPSDFPAAVADAQREIAEGITRAGLQRDPYAHVLKALGTVLGTFPDLVRHLEATRQPVQDEDLRRAVTRGVAGFAGDTVRVLNVRNILIGVALGVVLLMTGAVGGYLFRGAAPALASVRAGPDQCQDRSDGSRVCWFPVFDRLPRPSR